MTPYDPEAAVAEFEACCEEGGAFFVHGEPSERAVKDWLRAALDAAYRAGKREAWGKAHSLFRRDPDGETYLDVYLESDRTAETIRDAARADGVDL